MGRSKKNIQEEDDFLASLNIQSLLEDSGDEKEEEITSHDDELLKNFAVSSGDANLLEEVSPNVESDRKEKDLINLDASTDKMFTAMGMDMDIDKDKDRNIHKKEKVNDNNFDDDNDMEDEEEEEEDDNDSNVCKLLDDRLKEWKVATIEAKKAGNKPLSLERLRVVKQLKHLKEQFDLGSFVDVNNIPSKPPPLPVRSSSPSPQSYSVPIKHIDFTQYVPLEKFWQEEARQISSKVLSIQGNRKSPDWKNLEGFKKKRDEYYEMIKALGLVKSGLLDPPKFHVVRQKVVEECKCTDLLQTEMKIEIWQLRDLQLPMGVSTNNCYVYAELCFVSSNKISKIRTKTINDSADPLFEHVEKIPFEFKKSFLRTFERKKIVFSVYCPRGFLKSDLLVGKVEVPLVGLLTDCRVNAILPVQKPDSRRQLGKSVLEVSLCLREPLKEAKTVFVEKDVFVLDSPFPSAKKTQGQPQPQTMAATTDTNMNAKNNNQKEVETPASTAIPLDKKHNELLELVSSVDYIVSNDVMEMEISKINAMVKPSEELLDRKQMLEAKMNMLILQVQTEKITMESYSALLSTKIQEERKVARQFLSFQDKESAKQALQRLKIMQAEIA